MQVTPFCGNVCPQDNLLINERTNKCENPLLTCSSGLNGKVFSRRIILNEDKSNNSFTCGDDLPQLTYYKRVNGNLEETPLNDGEVYVNIADENASHTLMCRDQLEVPNDETRRVCIGRTPNQVFNDDTKLFEEMLINHKYPNYPFANKDACESRHFRQTFGADNIIHRECLNELDFCNKDADGDTYNWSKNSSISYTQNPNGATKEEICASCTSNDASVKHFFETLMDHWNVEIY